MSISDRISEFFSLLGASLKSAVKLALSSRRCDIEAVPGAGSRRLIVLGNGPALARNISEDLDILSSSDVDTLAVNFAANTDEFALLRPRYYLLMDPHYFTSRDPNVPRLVANLNTRVDWPMTLFIPVGRSSRRLGITNPMIRIEHFNPVGVEGFQWLIDWACDHKRGLPRPRNVLIPSIMVGIWLGYKEIYLLGADHSWLRTLDVSEENIVRSVQPHFYRDSQEEHKRVETLFRDIRLHELLYTFHLTFKGYHVLRRYASTRDVSIYNSTPGSFIDAFPRRPISSLRQAGHTLQPPSGPALIN